MKAASKPLIVGHRGASGYRPEHTLESYALAIEQGADAIEPDLVFTRDGQLVCRHDLGLARSTDVACRAEFASYWRADDAQTDNSARASGSNKKLDNSARASGDWFVHDFTYAELSQLRAIQPWPQRGAQFDGRFRIPLFGEVLELARQQSQRLGREILVYPEAKHPTHFAKLGHDFVSAMLTVMRGLGYESRKAPVLLQCFELAVLAEFRKRCDVRSFALIASGQSYDLAAVKAHCDGIGIDKKLLIDADGVDTGLCARAHALGLDVHAWTFRDDQPYAPFATPSDEYRAYLELGTDGLFSDFPDTALAARKRWLSV